MRFIHLLLVFFLFSTVISCRKQNEPDRAPSPTFILMEAEGGEEVIDLGSEGWQIVSVVNKNGDLRIFGDIYTADGQMVRENSLLELEGPGRLDGTGFNRGFDIVYDHDQIHVALVENGTDDVFRFAIVLKKGDEIREIVIEQKVSEGYTFQEITYALDEGDGDSLYRKTGSRYQFNLVTPQQVSVSPYGGVDVLRSASFESGDRDAFVWIRKDSVRVPVPLEIRDGGIGLSGPKDVYGAVTREPFHAAGAVAFIDVPAGGAHFSTTLEWRRRRLSYKLTLKNNRTAQLKEVTGKWVEESPTGKYVIQKDF